MEFPALKNHDLIISLLQYLVFHFFHLRFFERGVQSPFTKNFFEEKVLLPLLKIFASKVHVHCVLPLPCIALIDEVVTCAFEFIWRELTVHLEHVLLGRRTPFFTDILRQVVSGVCNTIRDFLHTFYKAVLDFGKSLSDALKQFHSINNMIFTCN